MTTFITVTTTMFKAIVIVLMAFSPGWLASMADAQIITYRAILSTLLPSSNSPAFGFATIFADTDKSVIGYAGIASKLESNLVPSQCTALNACGVHIHSGRSCASVTTQGGHYFNNVSVPIDPWIDEEYTTNQYGQANFQSIVNIGTVDIEGRVFIGTNKLFNFVSQPNWSTNQIDRDIHIQSQSQFFCVVL